MLNRPDIRRWLRSGISACAALGVAAFGHAQSNWTLQSPANHPVALLAPQMAYDALHQKVVLFSGTTAGGAVGDTPNDTWLWDGRQQSWTPVNPAHKPPGRVTAGMAYDAARQQIVMFGGGVGNTTFGDTWVWDGADWTQKSPAISPPARQAFSMAYDVARQQVVLFGGFSANSTLLNDTWTWDGNNWTQQNPATSPSPRIYHQLAYDEVRQETVLFGGDDFVDTDMISTTWVWNGTNWIARTPAAFPPGASTGVANYHYHSMVFDTATQQVVIFGGYNDGPQSATWFWDGTNWTQFAGTGPGPRYGTAIAYDSRNQQVVVFGGDFPTASGFYTFETWIFSTPQPAAAWVQQAPPASPPARASASMVFDSRRQQVVMFGGVSQVFLGDTWTWNGATWTLAATAGPQARVEAAFAYDELHQQAVLFSGGGVGNDTWIWDGATWTQKFPVHSPLGGVGVAMAYDGARQQVVLYGGKSGTTCLTGTWTWDGTDWTQKSPATVPVPNSDCGAAMTYDDTRQQVILVTGVFGVAPDKTYTWDGANWTLQAPATPLPERYSFQDALAYDSLRQKAVQFGGFSSLNGALAETWQWDGVNWAQLITTSNPAARTTAAMVFDPLRQRTVLFGGVGQDSIGRQLIYGDTWTLNPTAAPPAVNITVPAGIQFMFNGVSYTGSQSIVIAAGTYLLTTSSPLATGVGTQLRFAGWSDGGAQTHNVTVGGSDVNITGTFLTQYLLTLSSSPANGGLIASLGGPYYDAGTNVQVSALANLGFTFAGWAGACSGSNGCTVTMNAPTSVIATFNSQTFNLTINVPVGVHYTLSGLPLTGPATIALPQGTYSVAMASPQPVGTGVQIAFVSWSDGGAQSHDIILGAAAKTVTATFKTQYQVTVATTPANQGTAGFLGGPFFDVGTQVVVTATPNPGYVFEFWTGGCTGSNAFCIATVNVPLNLVAHFSVPDVTVSLTPPSAPTPRIGYALAYDPIRQEVVLFGGFSVSSILGSGGHLLDDTWTWNGTTWTQQFPAVHPLARSAHSMAYHAGSQSVILFGGDLGILPGTTSHPNGANDVWAWNGQLRTWTQKAGFPDNGRIGSFLTSYGSNVLLFAGMEPIHQTGGEVDAGALRNDTWIFDGTLWTQIVTAHAPAGRYSGAIAYDAIRSQVVLSGGSIDIQSGGTQFFDTWIFNGNDWQQAHPATTLTDSLVASAFDASLQQVVGLPISGTGNMWTWDGADWTKREAQMPAFDIAYDAARQQVMGVGYAPTGPNLFGTVTYVRVPARTSLVLASAPSAALDPVTNDYVITVSLSNQGNVPITRLDLSRAARLGLTNGSTSIGPVFPVLPGQTFQVTCDFPHNSASGRAAISLVGTYAAPPLTTSAGWSVNVAVNLP